MSQSIPCCLEVPDHFYVSAVYALEMLLFPLGLRPRWITRDALTPGSIYYGDRPPQQEGIIVCTWSETTMSYFASRKRLPTENVTFLKDETGITWPIPFADALYPQQPDWIAGTFFHLADWDAWTRRPRDQHGRFLYRHAYWHDLNLPPLPVVDFYREQLEQALLRIGLHFSPRIWGKRTWALAPTHDIDYVRKWRPGIFYRELVEHPLCNHRRQPAAVRWKRLRSFVRELLQGRDPYTTGIHRMLDVEERLSVTATYFLKAGAHGPRDVAYSLRSRRTQRIIQRIREQGSEIGLHPSYFTCTHEDYLYQEKKLLEKATGHHVQSSRQHYLRWYPQITPVLLSTHGLQFDSTLGFPDHEGFRNGTCLPFRIFDPVTQGVLPLWEVPLALMDSTLFHYRGNSVDEGIKQTLRWFPLIKRFRGLYVALWHEIIYDTQDTEGWQRHFERILEEALAQKARVASLTTLLSDWLMDYSTS